MAYQLRAKTAGVQITMDHLSSVPTTMQVDITNLTNSLNVYNNKNVLVATYSMTVNSTSKLAYYSTVLNDVFSTPGTYTLEQVATNGTVQVYRTEVPVVVQVT